jgi:teichoic acid transport system ATP-binding protein
VSERRAAVEVEHVRIEYRVHGKQPSGWRDGGRRRSVVAVDDVSFVAREGETVGVIGRNGSGKSSLLRAVAGLMPVTAGSIRAADMPILLGVGAALKGDLTGRQNIVLGGTALGARRRDILERADEIIEFSGLADSIDLPFKTYSSGMKARLQFSVSTAVQPSILLVDEALAVGDEEFKERSNDRIQQLVGGASTVFLVSHSLSTIKRRCDRALWLDRGKQVMWGSAADVVEAYRADMVERRARREAARAEKERQRGQRWRQRRDG